jgi:hypothetical protein
VTVQDPGTALVVGTAAAALAAVAVGPVRSVTGHLSTAAHEGGHALVALLLGYRVGGIRLHVDQSGLTHHYGPDRGPGRIAVAAAGYPAPSLLGLGGAALLAHGFDPLAPLLVGLAVMGGLLLLVRNLFGALVLVGIGAVFVLLTYRADPQVQQAAAYSLTWFLLLSGLRDVTVLRAVRRTGSRASDADQLRRLTRLPGLLWELVFALVAVGSLLLAGRWLLLAG